MTCFIKSGRFASIFAGSCLVLLSAPMIVALAAGQAPEGLKAPPLQGTEKATDPYAVPQTEDAQQLLQFIRDVQQHRPELHSQAEFVQHRTKLLAAIKAAAERITQVEKDRSSDAYKTAENILLQLRIGSMAQAPAAEQQRMLDEIVARLQGAPDRRDNAGLAISMARMLEYSSHPKLALEANQRFGEVLAKQTDPQLSSLGKMMQATARRLGLVGNEMQLTGTTVGGKPFDWKTYRGRVVLVDFWATWCGPCRAELPNVLNNYETYHDRGFDVVGISVDQDREALDKFLEANPVPWTTLHAEGGQHPAAEYYGVSAIPTTILVGRDGKVVSITARGPELTRLLEKLIGPPEPSKNAGQSAATSG